MLVFSHYIKAISCIEARLGSAEVDNMWLNLAWS